MSENGDQDQRVAMPSIDDLRKAASEMLAEINSIELATALKDGDRVDSYEPFIEWLRAHKNGELYVRQMIECLLFDASVHFETGTLRHVLVTAAQYLAREKQ